MEIRTKRGRPAKMYMHEEPKQGKAKNKGKQKKAKVDFTDSSHQSDSLYRPSPTAKRKHLIPDSKMMIHSRRSSLRSSKRLAVIEVSSASSSSHVQKSIKHLSTSAVFEPHDDPVETNKNSAYQTPAGLASPSIFLLEKSDEGTEKIGDSVSSEGNTENIPEVGEEPVAAMSMPNQMEEPTSFQAECILVDQQPFAEDIEAPNTFHEECILNQMEEPNLFQAECILVDQQPFAEDIEAPNTFHEECILHEQQPLAEDIQTTNNFEERANRCKSNSVVQQPFAEDIEAPNTFHEECILHEQQPLADDIQTTNNFEERANCCKSISVVQQLSTTSNFNLTEMVNLCTDEDDEVNSVGQSLPVNTVDKYRVKKKLMPILKKIISNHGDVVHNCTAVTIESRSELLEKICEYILELQQKGFSEAKADRLQDMIGFVNDMKNKNVDVEWLQQRLLDILEAKQIVKQSPMLKEKRECCSKTRENVERELKEKEEEEKALTAKLLSIRDEMTVCKEKLARAKDESSRITTTIKAAKSKVKRFLNSSLVDGLL